MYVFDNTAVCVFGIGVVGCLFFFPFFPSLCVIDGFQKLFFGVSPRGGVLESFGFLLGRGPTNLGGKSGENR